MGRPWRIEYPDAVYHVMARGNNRQEIYSDNIDRLHFLELLERSCDRFNLRVLAFCLMGNHYHLFFRTPDANLIQTMKWLNGTYTNWFNRRHKRIGHLFQGRYKAVLVTEDTHWLQLSYYIHLNPVRAGLVDDPAQYEWSSFRDYTRSGSRFSWLAIEEILSLYGSNTSAMKRRYLREALDLAGRSPGYWEELRNRIVLGSKESIEKLTASFRPSGDLKTVPEYGLLCRRETEPEMELRRLAEIFGVELDSLYQRRRDFIPRLAAYYYLVEMKGLKGVEVGRLLGVSGAAVSQGIRKFQALISEDKELAQTIAKL